jgi:hypothetical protein
MTVRTKQRFTFVALLALAIWPLVHRGLVARYDITPWKFMGFAMYCMPTLEPRVEVLAHFGERRAPVDSSEAHMRDLRREIARFTIFRQVWGTLLTPERVGEAAQSLLTRADSFEVVVTEGYLDRESWRLAARETVYEYHSPPRVDPAKGARKRKRGLRPTRRGL